MSNRLFATYVGFADLRIIGFADLAKVGVDYLGPELAFVKGQPYEVMPDVAKALRENPQIFGSFILEEREVLDAPAEIEEPPSSTATNRASRK